MSDKELNVTYVMDQVEGFLWKLYSDIDNIAIKSKIQDEIFLEELEELKTQIGLFACHAYAVGYEDAKILKWE